MLKESWHVFVLVRVRLVPKMEDGGSWTLPSVLSQVQRNTSVSMEKQTSYFASTYCICKLFLMFCTCSQCHKWVLSQIISVWLRKIKRNIPVNKKWTTYYFREGSPLLFSSNSCCLLSDRRSVAHIDYVFCSVKIMWGLSGLKPFLLRVKQWMWPLYILLYSGDTCLIQC